MLAAVIIFAAARASHAQNLIVSKTYYDTGLAFDGSQWTQNLQASPMTFTVMDWPELRTCRPESGDSLTGTEMR